MDTTLQMEDFLSAVAFRVAEIIGDAPAPPAAGTYDHVQSIPMTDWYVEHNLDTYPSVVALDSTGQHLIPTVTYITRNALIVSWKGATAGTATLR